MVAVPQSCKPPASRCAEAAGAGSARAGSWAGTGSCSSLSLLSHMFPPHAKKGSSHVSRRRGRKNVERLLSRKQAESLLLES